MQPTIHVLGLPVKTFGFMFALGFIAAGAVLAKRLKELGRQPDWAYEIAFVAMIGGLVGSRGWYVLQHTGELSDHPFKLIFGGSGLVWYGGAIGGVVGVLSWGRRRRFPLLALTDLCCVPLAFGYGIGRIGCQLSGDGDYGKNWSGPWAMAYPHGTVPTDQTVQPTPIYETVSMTFAALVLWHLRDRFRPGVLFAMYLVLSGTERFLIEFIRRNRPDLAGLTVAQLLSLGLMAAGAAALVSFRRRPGGLGVDPAAPTGAVAAA